MSIRRAFVVRPASFMVLTLVACTVMLSVPRQQVAGADSGETLTISGGQFISPAFTKMIQDDAAGASPTSLFFSGETVDSGISDFVGSAPSTFNADAALSERPLTSTEVATATTNGRSIAYVPFAATPVAIVTLVPTSTFDTSSPVITASAFCQHIPLSVDQLGGLFGLAAQPYAWGDPRIPCSTTEGLASYPVTRWANLDPTMENQALMTVLDSDPTAKAEFDAGLQQAQSQNAATTTSDTPSEHWPYSANTYPQGDQSLIEHMVNIDPRSNVPSTDTSFWHLGAISPMSAEWTGSPLGAVWDFPTAAVQNAANCQRRPLSGRRPGGGELHHPGYGQHRDVQPDNPGRHCLQQLPDAGGLPGRSHRRPRCRQGQGAGSVYSVRLGDDGIGRPREIRLGPGHASDGDGGIEGGRGA